MERTLMRVISVVSLGVLAMALACGGDDSKAADGAGAQEAPFGERVCTEIYVCGVGCLAGSPAAREACLKGCSDAADAEARPLYQALTTCREEQCTTAGAPAEPCLLEKCAAQIGACYDDARNVKTACPGQTPNEQGIGKECTEQSACTGLNADNCPYAMDGFTEVQRESLPQWCNHLCERDDECGAGAFCWQRRTVEEARGGALIGSCSLDACLID